MNIWKCIEKNCSGCTLVTPDNMDSDEGWKKDCLDGQLCQCSEWRLLTDKEKYKLKKSI
jgi:hypothetical protein